MQISLKRLNEDDLIRMMEWRMREDIAKNMFSEAKLTLEGQYKWFEKIKDDPSQKRWIIYSDYAPIGSIYLVDIDAVNRRCESGWFIAEKKYRSLELSVFLQWNMFDFAFEILKLNRVYGYIIDTNKELVRLLKYCGYVQEGILSQYVCKAGCFHDVYLTAITKEIWYKKKANLQYDRFDIEE